MSTTLDAVEVSPEAKAALRRLTIDWTGWADARLTLGPTTVSPYAQTDMVNHHVTANVDALVRNPNRVLLTLTPFRLRQEAVLTGAMLHEAAHARHSLWMPTDAEERSAAVHTDGDPVKHTTYNLARIAEEPRIEGRMAGNVDNINARGLAWTMRACAAYILPMTEVSDDPDQAVLDVVCSWLLRVGRQYAYQINMPKFELATWVNDFTSLLHKMLVEHFDNQGTDTPSSNAGKAKRVVNLLTAMVEYAHDANPTYMYDKARDVLALLFPGVDGDDPLAPQPHGSCADEEDPEVPPDADQPDFEDDPEADEEGGSGDDQGEGEGQDPGEGSGPQEGSGVSGNSALAEALAEMEQAADAGMQESAAEEAAATPMSAPPSAPTTGNQPGGGAGTEGSNVHGGDTRIPEVAEREVQRAAERFLRSALAPTETTKRVLTESPSACVDGGALAAWRAGGQVRDPHFFVRHRRNITDAPPIQIAVLADISSSMKMMQESVALLSWSIAAAALDLRNFAGRGVQVESCLVEWDTVARTVYGNGAVPRGIRTRECRGGTTAMDSAFDKVEQEMPGFFTGNPERPANRLLVQFTDWRLDGALPNKVAPRIRSGLFSGMNMLNVVPPKFAPRIAHLHKTLEMAGVTKDHAGPGQSYLMYLDEKQPENAWLAATDILTGSV